MIKLNKYDINYKKSIHSWDEALPIGNGKLGCLIYGDGPLHFSIDRVDLWDKRVNPVSQEEGFNFKNLVKLVKSGKDEDWKEYQRLFDDIYDYTPYPTKITAGRIELDFGIKTQNISSKVSLSNATATVLIDDGKVARIEAFMSATRFVGVARICGKYNASLYIPKYISGDNQGNWHNGSGIGVIDSDGCLHYPKAEMINDGEYLYYKQNTLTDYSYGAVVLRKDYGDYSELYFTVATNTDDQDYIEFAKKELSLVASCGYENLKAEHIAWWEKYWAKSEISVKDSLIEKVYYRSTYLFASTSRKGFYPMALQGVWTADNDSRPPWHGDYHHNLNTQLCYQSYLKANCLEEGENFIDYLWNLKPQFEKFAKEFYGVKGLVVPTVSTIDGKPFGGWPQYSLSPTNAIWVAQSFDEYYLYTGDKKFLKTRAYPFFKELGDAIYGLLEEKNCKLYLPLSSSSEMFQNTREAYMEPNTNYDLSLLIYLYKTLKKYCELLGKNGERYDVILSKLDDIEIIDNVVALSKGRKQFRSHRMHSHLMCMYPLHLLNFDTEENKRIYNATLFSMGELGSGKWVGYSFPCFAQICAMAKKGNMAYGYNLQFAHGFVADNGFHLNGCFRQYGYSAWDYRPFTLEANFAYCNAILEMLLQEHQGYIEVFPAVPTDWFNHEISFKKLRSYNGVLVSASKKESNVTSFSLYSKKTVTVKVMNNFGFDTLSFSNGQTIYCKQGETFVLTFKGNIKLIYGNR